MIDNPQNDFEKLENAIAAQLEAQVEFQGIKNPDGTFWHVLTEDEGDIEFLFQQMINQCGFSVVVQTPIGRNSTKMGNIPGPVFDPLECMVQVSEAVIFNRNNGGTNIHAETGASIVRRSLHLFHPPGMPGVNSVLEFIKVEKDRDRHPETGALVASRLLTFNTRLIEQSKTIQ